MDINVNTSRSELTNFWVISIRNFLEKLFESTIFESFLPFLEVVFWVFILLILDLLLQKIVGITLLKLIGLTKLKWDDSFYKHKVFRTLIHFIPAGIAINLNPYVFQKYAGIDTFANKIIGVLFIILFLQLVFRIIDSIIDMSKDENSYTTVGIRTFGQLIKIFSVFGAILFVVALLLNVAVVQILTVLGALTAVILLIFRDSILGFVSGLQISTSKSIKAGDWIKVNKYDVEGIIKEINLSIVKIEKFDKTISTLPTYDLISTEVTNFSAMTSTNTRRIKRSIVFNVNTFEFCSSDMLEKLKKIDLISEYIESKIEEIKEHNKTIKNQDLIVNGRQLTNIGVFRTYAENYLKSRKDISQNDKLMVRQLDLTTQGMPLEIYCFTNTSNHVTYEQIQSDIFDHLISACKEFDLEVSQPFIIQNNHD